MRARSSTLNVLSNDRNLTSVSSELRLLNVSDSSKGSSVVANSELGTVTYIPAPGYVGDDVFTYVVEDEFGNRDSAQVVIQVTEDRVNGNLQANNDTFTVTLGESSMLQVLANDDVQPSDAGQLNIEGIIQPPSKGVVKQIQGVLFIPLMRERVEKTALFMR